jgi:hypothetical protein
MGFLLESPVQIVRFSHPHLSTRRGALQILVNPSAPFDNDVHQAARDVAAAEQCDALGDTRKLRVPSLPANVDRIVHLFLPSERCTLS